MSTLASESRERRYFAVLTTEISADGPGHVPAVEKNFVLFRADSDERAQDAAAAFARRKRKGTSDLKEDGAAMRTSHLEVTSIYEVLPWSQELYRGLFELGTSGRSPARSAALSG